MSQSPSAGRTPGSAGLEAIEQAREAALLRRAILPLLVAGLAGAVVVWLPGFTQVPLLGTAMALSMVGLLAALELLNRRGRTRLAGLLFLLSVHAGFIAMFFLFGGLDGPYPAAFPVLVCLAGLVRGRRAVLLSLGLDLVALASAYVLTQAGFVLPTLSRHNPLAAAVIAGGLTALVAYFLWVALDELARARSLRETYERERREAHRLEALGRLAGGVAHDLNNLLTVILADSEEPRPGAPSPVDDHQRRAEIQAAGRRAADLTQQLLAFARRQVLEPRLLDLNRTIAELRPMLGRLLREDIELRLELDPDLPAVLSDPARLEQVVVNLAVNAQDAMPRGGRLTLETRRVDLDQEVCRRHPALRPGPHVLLSVSDTGVGIQPEHLERVFEPFFTTKGERGGSGLGLATVQGIIAQSGGAVLVYSEPGQGATFKVFLPAQSENAPEGAARVGAAGPGEARTLGRGRVALLADDDESVRAVTRRMLEVFGFKVLLAADGQEALRQEASHAGGLDLLVTDVVMAHMDGVDLAATLLARRPALKVLFISGYSDEAVQGNGVLRPGARFVSKPFSLAQLEERLRELLEPPARG